MTLIIYYLLCQSNLYSYWDHHHHLAQLLYPQRYELLRHHFSLSVIAAVRWYSFRIRLMTLTARVCEISVILIFFRILSLLACWGCSLYWTMFLGFHLLVAFSWATSGCGMTSLALSELRVTCEIQIDRILCALTYDHLLKSLLSCQS